jgi:hypothetical protein
METIKKIKSFEQFLSEKVNVDEAVVREPNEMLVSITKTVVVDNDEKNVWDIHEDFMKEVMEITEDAEGFVFTGDGFDRKNNDTGGFEITSNIKFLYNAPDADEKDLKSMFRNLSGDVDIEISEVEVE